MVGGVSTLSSSIKAWKAAGTGFTGTLEKISAGIGIVTGAITVLGAVFKLFKGPSGELKALRRDLGDLSGLTKDWTKELEKAAKAIGGLGSAGRAVNNVFDEMVRTSNITLQNFNQWSERLRNIFSGFTQGFAGANETATNFGKGFDALIEKAKQLGIEGGKATTGWILMFEDMKKQGVFVQEIFDYIQKSSQAGLAGYKQMLESISTTDIESEIAKLKESMMGVVVPIDNAAQLLQLSELEAKLKEAQKLQAVFGNASIQLYDDMLAYEKKVSENQTLVNAVKGWGLAMTNFTNVFRVESQGQFDEYQATLKNQVDALKAAGFTDAEIFQMMQDQLSRINLISNDFGWILDDGTKAILEQAKALGYVTDNQTKIKTQQQTMGEGFKMVTDAVFLLVETLGGTVPEAMKKASQEVLNFQDAASNTPAMVFDAVVQDDVMSTVQSDLEKTARIAATTATSMENDFMSFRSQVEAVNQSIIELKANLESMQSMSISAGYNESPLSPVPVSRMSEPSGRRTLDINIKMSGEASGKSQSDIANKLIGYFEKLGNKNKTDYDIVRDLKRIVNNNVDGFRSFLSGELNG